MGVNFDKSRNKYVARATIDGQRIYLGRFNTEDEAKQVYFAATDVCEPFNLEYEYTELHYDWKSVLKEWSNVFGNSIKSIKAKTLKKKEKQS